MQQYAGEFKEQDHPRADDGKFGSGSGKGEVSSSPEPGPSERKPEPTSTAKADKVASTWLAKAKAVPAKALNAARGKVKSTYAKLDKRYGAKYARAILAAGLLGVPLPIPGSSFLTAGPIIAVAELHRALAKPAAQPAAVKAQAGEQGNNPLNRYAAEADLSAEQIAELGKAFMAEVMGHQAEAEAPDEAPEKYDAAPAATMPGGANAFVPDTDSIKKRFSEKEFITVKRPIFDEHDQLENEEWKTTPEVLSRIIDRFKERAADTGDYPVVTDGHTPDDPDKRQPDVLGFATDFSLGRIGKVKPRKAIIAEMKIYRDKAARLKTLPRCSVELWPDMVADPVVLHPDKHPIDTIALLGAERPARDLGLMYSKIANGKHRYSHTFPDLDEKDTMTPDEIKRLVIDCISEWETSRKAKEAEACQTDAQPMEYEEDKAGDLEEMPEEKEVVPDGGEVEEDEAVEPAKLRMQRDQLKRRYAKLEADHKKLAAEVEGMKKKARLSERKADLMQLEGEGFIFDMADEVEYIADLEPKRYSLHLKKIKKNYKQGPVNVAAVPAATPGETTAVRSPADVYAQVGMQTRPTLEASQVKGGF
jgi:hypothetical protein